MSGWQVQSIFHFTVTATNFERSLDFYTALGFRVLRDNRDVIWPEMVGRNLGIPGAQGRGALLGIGDGPEHTRLDLIEWLEPEQPPPTDLRIIALRTENVQAAYDDLSAQGIPFLSEVQRARKAGILGVCTCTDPDGLRVELIEYAPGVLGSRIDDLERREKA